TDTGDLQAMCRYCRDGRIIWQHLGSEANAWPLENAGALPLLTGTGDLQAMYRYCRDGRIIWQHLGSEANAWPLKLPVRSRWWLVLEAFRQCADTAAMVE